MDNKAFDFKRIAQGYKDRPFLHSQVMEQLQKEWHETHFYNGLDVGCGAGLSTKGLKQICDKATGTDISEEMILVAKEMCPEDGYTFFACPAEETPVSETKYDIVTAAGMVQWVEQEKFLGSLSKVMEKNGLLFIYDFWISDKMEKTDSYTDWWHNQYLVKFPRPARKDNRWTAEEVAVYGFMMEKQNTFTLHYEFDKDSFIKFMLIQSNVNAKIEGEGQDIEEISAWFEETLEPIFQGQKKMLVFEGYSWYICYR